MVSRPYGIQHARTRNVFRRPILLTAGISVLAHALAIYIILDRSWQPGSAGSDIILEIGLNVSAPVPASAPEASAPEPSAPDPTATESSAPGLESPPAAATPAAPDPSQPEVQRSDAAPPERVEPLLPEAIASVPDQEQIIVTTESSLQLPPQSNPETSVRSASSQFVPDIEAIPPPSPPEPMSTRDLHILEPAVAEWIKGHEWQDVSSSQMLIERDGRRFDVTATASAGDPTALNQITLEITTTLDGKPVKSLIQVRETAFSHYAKFVNRWDKDVSLANDWVEGRFHSNSPITVADPDQAPHFNGPVTIAARQRISRWLRNADIFKAGVETGVDQVPLPRHVPIPDVEEASDGDRIHYFEHDTDIEFLANGEYVWRSTADSSGRERMGDETTFLLARDKASLSIKGIVRGRVLVYSPRRISINGNLHYSKDPQQFPESEDLLGIVSDGSVEIADSRVTGPGDLTVQGAILARTRFSVRRFRDRNQGTLFIYGSMAAGSVSATEPRFSTHIRHDPRLVDKRPPAFPTTGNFEMAAWDRQWHSQEAQPGAGISLEAKRD